MCRQKDSLVSDGRDGVSFGLSCRDVVLFCLAPCAHPSLSLLTSRRRNPQFKFFHVDGDGCDHDVIWPCTKSSRVGKGEEAHGEVQPPVADLNSESCPRILLSDAPLAFASARFQSCLSLASTWEAEAPG